jgi:hypothetical protein
MRSAAAALAWSMANATIPQSFVGTDGIPREVDDLECARSVMAAYDIIPIADMGTANRMWERTVGKNSSRSPRRGAPVYFYNARAGSSGHVALATGSGEQVWTTPVWLSGSGYKGLHLTTISALAILCGNAYSGWGIDFAGMPINFTSTAGGGSTPFPDAPPQPKPKDDIMQTYIRFVDSSGIAEYALCAPEIIPGGFYSTKVLAEAEAYSILTWGTNQTGAPWDCKNYQQFTAITGMAAKLAVDYRKQNPSASIGDVTVPAPDNKALIAAMNANAKAVTDGLAAVLAATKALNPPG